MPSVIPTHYEDPVDAFPFPSPFILSSVERDWCGRYPGRVRFIKRRHLEENLKSFEQSIGMGEDERNKFLDYYCQPGDRNQSEILAEKSGFFDLRYRAKKWMERTTPANQPPKSRLEKYAESAQQFYRNIQAQAVSGSHPEGQGCGDADTPDEQ